MSGDEKIRNKMLTTNMSTADKVTSHTTRIRANVDSLKAMSTLNKLN
jgi:hypothetical protein